MPVRFSGNVPLECIPRGRLRKADARKLPNDKLKFYFKYFIRLPNANDLHLRPNLLIHRALNTNHPLITLACKTMLTHSSLFVGHAMRFKRLERILRTFSYSTWWFLLKLTIKIIYFVLTDNKINLYGS